MLAGSTPAERRVERAPETRAEMMGAFQREWRMPMRRVDAGWVVLVCGYVYWWREQEGNEGKRVPS